MKDPIDEIREALEYPDFLERIDELRGYDVAERRLLDRLEAAEKAVTEAYQRGYATGQEEIEKERDALRADKEALEREAVRLVEQADSVAADLVSAWKERDALRAEIERLQSNLSSCAQVFMRLEAVAAEARRNDAIAMSWINEAKHAIGYEGDMPGFIQALRGRRRLPEKITVSQAPHSQYARGWNDCIEACAAICGDLEELWTAEKDSALLNGDVALSNAVSGEPRAARKIKDQILAQATPMASSPATSPS